MRVLVTGGRTFINRVLVAEALNKLHGLFPGGISCLIHGGARGADAHCALWAKNNGIPVQLFKADWDQYGKSAGFLRNQQMLTEGNPDVCIVFPGGRGTEDMARRARSANVLTWEAERHNDRWFGLTPPKGRL